MKVSLNWIKEFTDIKYPVEELVSKIGAQLGEVEEVINLGEKYDGIVTAKVISCEKHPNADKLSVCKIDDGKAVKGVSRDENGLVQVVCGAPNVRRGIMVVWIPPGRAVPSTYYTERFTLEAREIRGVISNGMLGSGKELAINDDHEGILILDKPNNPGTPITQVYKLDDHIIDIENKMFTHRPDCFGQLGVAREIAGIQGLQFSSPDWYKNTLDAFKVTAESKLELLVENQLPDLAPRFMAVAMSGVNVMKSPIMVQSFLQRVGVKPINNIVDITNFVMMLTGQPMHAYDYDKLIALDNSKAATLAVRKPKKGEKLLLLDGKTIEPHKDTIMIASKSKLIGVGGIMGGAETEVDENTKNIVLECANFDMYSVRRSSMVHGLFTEAVTRFNKGQSPLQNDKVLAYAVAWVQKLANGHVASQLIDNNHTDKAAAGRLNKTIKITPAFINERLGTKLTAVQIKKLLINVEFEVDAADKEIKVIAPFWRTDIEIKEDVVEEVGRLHGYDHLPLELPKRSISPSEQNSLLLLKQRVRAHLAAMGANEILTYSFVHGKLFEAVGQDKALAFSLSNALSPDLQHYRLSLTPSLLDKVHANIKAGHAEFALFEINKIHDKSNMHEDGLPIEGERLALIFAADDKARKQYSGSPYYQAGAYLNELGKRLGVNLVTLPQSTGKTQSSSFKQMQAPFDKQRVAAIQTEEGVVLGLIGEIKPAVKKALKLPEFTAGFELDLQLLREYSGKAQYKILSRFPHSTQDISFKVIAETSVEDLKKDLVAVLQAAKSERGYTYDLEVLDIYQDENAKSKHVAFRITLSHPEKTLVTEEVNTLFDELALQLKKRQGATRL